jgi:hypothetical protein
VRQRLLAVSRGFGDLHVVRIKVAIADNTNLADAFERLADHFEQRRPKIPRDPEVAGRTSKPRCEHVAERLTAGRKALYNHGLDPIKLQRLSKLMSRGTFIRSRVLRLIGDVFGEPD